MKAGDKYRDSQGDTWTVQYDGTFMWDESAGYAEPLFHSLAELEAEYGPIRPVGHGLEPRIWCDRNGEVWQVARDGSLLPLDVDLDELAVDPPEDGDPKIGHDHDPVKAPSYYRFPGGVEVRDIARHLTSNGGQGVQYFARATRLDGAHKSDRVEDLRKAIEMAQDEIARLGAAS